MNEQELRQRAALAVLPECLRIAKDNEHLLVTDCFTGERVRKDFSELAAYMAAVIAGNLIKELERQELSRQRKKDRIRDFLKWPVEWIVKNKKAKEALEQAGLKTVADVVQCNRKDLLSIKDFGSKSLCELENKLEFDWLYIGMDISEYMEEQP